MGLPTVPAKHQREHTQANEIVRRTAALLRAAHTAGAEFVLEHPADRGALASPISLNKRHAPLWLTADIIALKADTAASYFTFAQCALGATSQKYTTLLTSPGVTPPLQKLSNLRCQHPDHPDLAGGSKTSSGWTSNNTRPISSGHELPPRSRHRDTPAGPSSVGTTARAGRSRNAIRAGRRLPANPDRTVTGAGQPLPANADGTTASRHPRASCGTVSGQHRQRPHSRIGYARSPRRLQTYAR
eukprot:2256888-Pleurochrysis_carterae.AAC.2